MVRLVERTFSSFTNFELYMCILFEESLYIVVFREKNGNDSSKRFQLHRQGNNYRVDIVLNDNQSIMGDMDVRYGSQHVCKWDENERK